MRLRYDANGNILSLNRYASKNGTPTSMDSLKYQYINGTNKLLYVDDAIDAKNFDNDIDDQNPNNYSLVGGLRLLM